MYASCDAVVVPSRRPEAFGRVLLEAVGARRLVVAFHHGAIGEIAAKLWAGQEREAAGGGARRPPPPRVLAPGVLLLGSVLLVPPGDVAGLATALACAARLPEDEVARRTAAAAAAAAAHFGLERFVRRVLAVYGGALDQHPRALGAA